MPANMTAGTGTAGALSTQTDEEGLKVTKTALSTYTLPSQDKRSYSVRAISNEVINLRSMDVPAFLLSQSVSASAQSKQFTRDANLAICHVPLAKFTRSIAGSSGTLHVVKSGNVPAYNKALLTAHKHAIKENFMCAKNGVGVLPESHVFVVEQDGELLSTISFRCVIVTSSDVCGMWVIFEWLYTRPDAREHGYAKLLVEAAIQTAIDFSTVMKCRYIYATTQSSVVAVKFWSKFMKVCPEAALLNYTLWDKLTYRQGCSDKRFPLYGETVDMCSYIKLP